MRTTRATVAALALALSGPILLAQPTTPAPSAPASPATDDGKDPNAARDVTHYNLDKQGLAIQGWDPVAYYPEGGGKPAKGKQELSYKYRGATYRFATQQNLERFKADPRKYEPAHGGWCSSAMADGGRKVTIDPKAYKITNGRLFLFYTDLVSDARSFWNKDEPKHTAEADTQWKKVSGEEPRKPAEAK